MNIPKEISEKYNFLKQQTFESLGLVFNPGVSTYVAPSQTSLEVGYQSQSKSNQMNECTDYQSSGGSKKSQDQLFTQIEEVMKSMTEHLSNMTKSIILEEDSSFVQESLSKKFTESLAKKDYHFTQIPKEFLTRLDTLKQEYDKEIKKLVDHFAEQKEEIATNNDRKIDLLKQECNKYKNEVHSMKVQMDKHCMCKYYEENMAKLKDEHLRYVDKIKQKYESEIYDIRVKQQSSTQVGFDQFREKLFFDINERVVSFVKERHQAYLNSYCQENGVVDLQRQLDPIELLFYISSALQGDNNWLVDKLAEVQQEITKLEEKTPIKLDLNSQLYKDIVESTNQSLKVLDTFSFQRNEFLSTLESSANPAGKENLPMKKNNYQSVRESIQSARSQKMLKSFSNNHLRTGSVDSEVREGSFDGSQFQESRDYYRDINK